MPAKPSAWARDSPTPNSARVQATQNRLTFIWILLSTLVVGSLHHPCVAKASPEKTPATSKLSRSESGTATPWHLDRPVKVVVIGGSISKYYAGNFGQYLQYGCKKVEVLNRGKVGAGGAELSRILRQDVLGDPATARGLHAAKAEGWVLFQGGLNSVGSPQSTAYFLSRLFEAAHGSGLKVMALTLSPWGSDSDARFAGWRGLATVQATEHVVEFVLGHLYPAVALGTKGQGHDTSWSKNELPDIAIDLWHSPLAADSANPLRERGPLETTFGQSPFARRAAQKAELLRQAQQVPRHYLGAKYRDFDHIHPNSAGHRVMAALACQKAPPSWDCDCDAIRHSQWKGKVVADK